MNMYQSTREELPIVLNANESNQLGKVFPVYGIRTATFPVDGIIFREAFSIMYLLKFSSWMAMLSGTVGSIRLCKTPFDRLIPVHILLFALSPGKILNKTYCVRHKSNNTLNIKQLLARSAAICGKFPARLDETGVVITHNMYLP